MSSASWHYFARFYREFRLDLGLLLAASLFLVLMNLAILFIIRLTFDTILPGASFRPLLLAGAAIICLYILNGILLLWTRTTMIWITERVVQRFRSEVLGRLLSLARSFHTSEDRSRLHTIAVQDTERLDAMSNALIGHLVPAVFISFVMIGALVYIKWILALSLILFIPLLIFWNKIMGRKLRQEVRAFHRSFESYSKGVMFVLRSLDLMRIQSAEGIELERRSRDLKELGYNRAKMVRLNTVYQLGQNSVIAILGVVILVIGGSSVFAGRMTMGDLIAFYAAVAIMKTHLHTISNNLPVVFEGHESLKTLYDWMEVKNYTLYSGTKKVDFRGEITFESVSFQFAEDPTLREIQFKIIPGQTTAIYGPNGAGKTTIANLILGFYQPDKGQIYMDGIPLIELDIIHLRQFIGVVRQDPLFFQGTILENLTYGTPDINPEDIIRMSKLATAHEFIESLHDGYDTLVGEEGMQLSGGQLQRISIARALVRRPRLLILDEPTLHLDGKTVEDLIANLEMLEFVPSILLISHDMEVIRNAQSIHVVSQGRIIKSGTFQEVDLESYTFFE